MRQIIDRKIYDTEKAILLAEYWNGLGENDFRKISEDLYITKKGQFFLNCSGGAKTKYAETNGRENWESEKIILLDKDETYQWLEGNNEIEVIEEYFSDYIKEA